jgi:uncharacterized membrane protein YbhN (UPF0104 family)
MIGWLAHLFDEALRAARLIVHDAVRVEWQWLALGALLHVIALVVRLRGWFNILRVTFPEERGLRMRDAVRAYLAGSGLNAIVPARGGDVLKVYFIDRRMQRGDWAKVVGTFVPETVFESAVGIALLVWTLARGWVPIPQGPHELPNVDVSLAIEHPILTTLVLGSVSLLLVLLFRLIRGVFHRMRAGLKILHQPRTFFVHVVTWQALGRLIRLGSLACFLEAFHLPVTLSTVVLVMAAQGGGRIIPFGPASAGLRLAMLTYGFAELTDKPVDVAAITTFTFGVGTVLFVVMLGISIAMIGLEFGTLSPRRAFQVAKAKLAARGTAPKPSPTG